MADIVGSDLHPCIHNTELAGLVEERHNGDLFRVIGGQSEEGKL